MRVRKRISRSGLLTLVDNRLLGKYSCAQSKHFGADVGLDWHKHECTRPNHYCLQELDGIDDAHCRDRNYFISAPICKVEQILRFASICNKILRIPFQDDVGSAF